MIDADTQLDSPIRLRFAVSATSEAAPTACFPRLLVVAGERSRASLVLEHETRAVAPEPGAESSPPIDPGTVRAPGFTAFVAEYHLGAGAQVETVQVQDEDASRIHFTSTHARLDAERLTEIVAAHTPPRTEP